MAMHLRTVLLLEQLVHKVGFSGYLLSDICCLLAENDTSVFNATEIEEVITSSEACPCDIHLVEYVVIYWKTLGEIFSDYGEDDLSIALNQLQVKFSAEDDALVFVQV